jgi:hypothetical protein
LCAENFCRDFELPTDIPLAVLYPRLLAVLQKASGRIFGTSKGVVLKTANGILRDPQATLSDYGVCTGSYLTVMQEE